MNESFNSRLGTIAAAAGSAVGLGNVWRFPYIMGENGGAAFLLIYVFFIILIALPVLITEFAIGRMTGKSIVDAFRSLAPGKKWYFIGFSGVLCAFVILSFYNIVSGWTLQYTYKSIVGDLLGQDETQITNAFVEASTDCGTMIFWMILIVVICTLIVAGGVRKGIERYSKILMPTLFFLIILMCIRAVTLEGSSAGLEFLLNPDFSKITPKVCFAALGQAFFSMSIGMGCMTTYGAYIPKDQDIARGAASVAGVDFLVAFLSGVIIFPCAFAFGINPDQGAGLVFVTLPNIFNQMFLGQAISIIFFVLLAIAAITSSISLLEVLTSFFRDQFKVPRLKAAVIMSLATIVTGTFCVFFDDVFNFCDNFSANVLLPLGAFFIVLFVPSVIGRERIKAETERHGKPFRLFNVYYFLIRFVVPIGIMLIFVNGFLAWCGIDLF